MNDPAVCVRPAEARDVPALARLRLALLEETGTPLAPAERAALLAGNEAFHREHLASPQWANWVGEAPGGEVVAIGMLALFLRPPYPGNPEGRDAYLLNMYTQPAHRGRGVASAIVQAALAQARAWGARKIVLHATEAGRRRYRAVGFEDSAAYMELRLP